MSQLNLPRGGLSTILLSVLMGGDKYGVEILNEIKKEANIEVKQPTLYATLSKLEKLGQISSYWRDGEIGGKRHYYRLTDLGKKIVLESDNLIVTPPLFNEKSAENRATIDPNQKYDEIGDFSKVDEELVIETAKTDEENLPIVESLALEDKKGIFIEEKYEPEDIPKVKKIDEAKISLNVTSELDDKLQTTLESTDTEKINELYSKVSANDTVEEKTVTYRELKNRYDEMNVGFHNHAKEEKTTVQSLEVKIPCNRLFTKYFVLFLCVVIESLAVGLTFYLLNGEVAYSLAYFIVPAIFAIPPMYFLFNRKSFKKFGKNTNAMFFNILILLVGIILLYSLNMLIGLTFANIWQYETTFIYPAVLLLNLIVIGFFDVSYAKRYNS